MNWATIKPALIAWVRSATGLDAEHVIWAQQGRPRPSGQYVELEIAGPRVLGQDWLDVVSKPLVLADDVVEAVDVAANTLTLTGHLYLTGDGPVELVITGGTAHGGLAAGMPYWIRKFDANKITFHSRFTDAINNVAAVDITGSAGTGTHTIVDRADTVRAGQEIQHKARGTREIRLTIQVFQGDTTLSSGAASPAAEAATPTQLAEQILAYVRLPSIRDALRAAGVGYLGPGPVNSLDGSLGFSVFEPRATVDVRLHAVSEVVEDGTVIETVELEPTVNGASQPAVWVPEQP